MINVVSLKWNKWYILQFNLGGYNMDTVFVVLFCLVGGISLYAIVTGINGIRKALKQN